MKSRSVNSLARLIQVVLAQMWGLVYKMANAIGPQRELQTPNEKELDALSQVQDTITSFTADTVEAITGLEKDMQETPVHQAIIKQSAIAVSDADLIIQDVTQNAALTAQNRTIEAYEDLGGDETYQALLSEFAEDSARVNDLLDKRLDITDDEPTSSGLLNTVLNEFRSISTDAHIEVAQAKQQQTAYQLQTIRQATSGAAEIAALTTKTTNTATVKANLDKIQAKNTADLAAMDIEAIAANAANVKLMQSMSYNAMSAQLQTYRLANEQQDRAMATERFTFQKQRFVAEQAQWAKQEELRTVQLAQAQQNLEVAIATNPSKVAASELQVAENLRKYNELQGQQAAAVGNIQAAQKAVGTTVEDRATILAGMGMGGDLGKKYNDLFAIGSSAAMGDPGSIKIGATPYDSQATLTTVLAGAAPKSTKANKLLRAISQNVAQSYKPKAGESASKRAPTDEATLKADYNRVADEMAIGYASEIATGDATNPYTAPPMAVLVAHTAVADSVFYKAVVEPVKPTNVEPEKLAADAVAAIRAKVITFDQAAAGLESIFDSAVLHNNSIEGGLGRIGFMQQKSYNVRMLETRSETAQSIINKAKQAVNIVGILASQLHEPVLGDTFLPAPIEVVDLTNPTDVRTLLTRMLADTPPIAPKVAATKAPAVDTRNTEI